MRIRWCLMLLAVSAMFATHSVAFALRVAAPSLAGKFMEAETVIVGRVVGLEDQDVEIEPFKGSPQKATMRVAIVKVDEVIQGDKDAKSVRLGFVVPKAPQGGKPGIIISSGGRGMQFSVGQAGLFYLTKHHSGKFETAPSYYSFQTNQSPNYANELTQLRKLVEVKANPVAAIKGGDADNKLIAVGMLLHQYRTNPGDRKQPKMEPAPAEENKLILKALAAADWKAQPMGPGEQTHPYALFLQLGVTKADGYEQPKGVRDIQQIYANAQRWLTANQDKFQIKRYVK